MNERENTAEHCISVKNVCKSFNGVKVLDNISFTLPKKGVVRLEGPSGSGKTTMLRLLCRLTPCDSGSIEGTEDKKISCVFQEDRLLPWRSALKNVELVSDRQTAHTVLSSVGLGEALDKLPAQLSGGMRRRVALARALAYGGDVLVLDEPFSGVDVQQKEQALAPLIRHFAQEGLVLIVTHDEKDMAMLGGYISVLIG